MYTHMHENTNMKKGIIEQMAHNHLILYTYAYTFLDVADFDH